MATPYYLLVLVGLPSTCSFHNGSTLTPNQGDSNRHFAHPRALPVFFFLLLPKPWYALDRTHTQLVRDSGTLDNDSKLNLRKKPSSPESREVAAALNSFHLPYVGQVQDLAVSTG